MKILLWLIGVVLVGVGGFYVFNHYIYNQKQADTAASEPYRATLTGEQVCLPHKDTSGPQTRECASGIKTVGGEYYALDFALMSQSLPNIPNGARFTANGTITPIERLSSDHLQKYAIEGVFSVTDGVEVEEESEPASDNGPVSLGPCYVGGCSSQVCSDREDVVTTCEFRPEYACYQKATCERQASGQCGWTQTPTLQSCLATPPTE